MAQLPLVRERSVQTQAAPDQFQKVSYDPEAFGAGIGRALQNLGAQGQELAHIQAQIQHEVKANDALTNLNSAKDEMRQWMYDPQDGILAKTGGNARGSGAQAAVNADDIKKRYLAKITDPETKAVWTKLWDREAEQAKDQASSHELSQMGEYQNQTVKGTLLGSMQDAYNAYNDNKAVDKAIDTSLRAIRANAAGAPPEIVKASEADAVSGIRLAVLSRLAVEDPTKGMEYYRAHAKDFSGKDHVTATQFIQPALDEETANQWMAGRSAQGGKQTYDLYGAVEHAESSGDTNAQSDAGASGLMQLMPATARAMAAKIGRADLAHMDDEQIKAAISGPANAELNRALGRTYLNEQLKAYNGDIEAALVAYNAGPTGADAFLEHNAGRQPGQRDYNVPGRSKIKTETEGYVRKVMAGYSGGNGPMGQAATRMTAENWGLRNFKPSDLIAPTGGGAWVDAHAAQSLDSLADKMSQQFPGFKIKVNEERDPNGVTAGRRRGTADPKDNPHVSKSQHLAGDAFDIQVQGWSDEQKAAFLTYARQAGFGGIGFYGPKGHLHIDMGNTRTWGTMPEWAKGPMQTAVGAHTPGQVQVADASGRVGYSSAGPGPTVPTGRGSFYAGIPEENTNVLLEAAQSLTDASVRARVESKIRIQGAQQTAAAKQQIADDKTAAWQTVLNSSSANLDPQLVARLDPGFMNGLRTFEENRAKGGPMPQDDRVWASASTDIEALKAMSSDEIYTTYRNKLDDSHFDKLLDLYRAAHKENTGDAHANDLMANARSRSDILKDAGTLMGWDPKGANASAQYAASLAKAFDDKVLIEQASKDRKLNSTEMQDIVDKLLITDKSVWSPGEKDRALASADPKTFVAASTWDEVQKDDQQTLTKVYSRRFGGNQPSREDATEIYNRAMQIYLGADIQPEGSFVDYLQRGANQLYQRNLTPAELKDAYNRLFLSFLGR